MSWWTKNLSALRHQTRQAFKLWSAQLTAANKSVFKASKATYQREIRIAKHASWKTLCEKNLDNSELFSALKNHILQKSSSIVGLPSTMFRR